MKITERITAIGNSSGVIISKPILRKLKAEKGDFVEIDIVKLDLEKKQNIMDKFWSYILTLAGAFGEEKCLK